MFRGFAELTLVRYQQNFYDREVDLYDGAVTCIVTEVVLECRGGPLS